MSSFTIDVPPNFHLEGSIRSYGFYLLAPNFYDREKDAYIRPLHIGDKVLQLQVSQNKNAANSHFITVKCDKKTNAKEQEEVKKQLSRILRLDSAYMEDFYNVFPTAKDIGYGRLFRSPTLYEDIVKTMTNVNTTFSRTQTMNSLICQHYGTDGAFPSARTLGNVSAENIQENCSVGYRADRIVKFARHVADGKIDLGAIEALAEKYLQSKRSAETKSEAPAILATLKKKILSIHGLGEFSANNILQLLGIFDIIPSDSETARHLREHHKINLHSSKDAKDVHKEAQKVYAKYEPYQFLVYWYNLYDFGTRFKLGFYSELASPAPASLAAFASQTTSISSSSSSSTTTTTTTMTITKVTKKAKTAKEEKKDKKESKTKEQEEQSEKRGQKRNTVDEKEEGMWEEWPRRSKRLSLGKSSN